MLQIHPMSPNLAQVGERYTQIVIQNFLVLCYRSIQYDYWMLSFVMWYSLTNIPIEPFLVPYDRFTKSAN
jgi:hypothetical protein